MMGFYVKLIIQEIQMLENNFKKNNYFNQIIKRKRNIIDEKINLLMARFELIINYSGRKFQKFCNLRMYSYDTCINHRRIYIFKHRMNSNLCFMIYDL